MCVCVYVRVVGRHDIKICVYLNLYIVDGGDVYIR